MKYYKRWLLAATVVLILISNVAAQNYVDFRPDKSFFSFGDWLIYRADDDDVVIYRDDGDIALEFIVNSDGWWHLRYSQQEYVVWSSGETEPQGFFTQPWNFVFEQPTPLGDGAYLQTGNITSMTEFIVDGDYLTIFLSNSGVVEIYETGYVIDFYSSNNSYFLYPHDLSVDDWDWDYSYSDYDDYNYYDIGLIGRRVEIVDVDEVYTTINQTDVLTWPDQATKELAGANSWTHYWPSVGDVGSVIWTSEHADSGAIVALVLIDGNYVCLGLDGISAISYSRGEVPYIIYSLQSY